MREQEIQLSLARLSPAFKNFVLVRSELHGNEENHEAVDDKPEAIHTEEANSKQKTFHWEEEHYFKQEKF